MKIYTKTGDRGETGLFGGGRVGKDHPRVMAYGDIDELNATIGLVRTADPAELFDGELQAIQRDLFALGGQLASPRPEKVRAALAKADLPESRIGDLERGIDAAEAELPPLEAFVLPAGGAKAAALHFARTVCRRAERQVVALSREAEVPAVFLIYLNRLSDYLFVLARLANRRAGRPDVTW
jgi:cob(I)alamin adenosyltransferase